MFSSVSSQFDWQIQSIDQSEKSRSTTTTHALTHNDDKQDEASFSIDDRTMGKRHQPSNTPSRKRPRESSNIRPHQKKKKECTTDPAGDIHHRPYTGPEKFLTPKHDPDFQQVVNASYQGFVYEPASAIDPAFHSRARAAFERLRDSGYFQYDVVMAGGKKLSRTFVKRTLVGNPGITYKYLGLRLFAHSWGSGHAKGGPAPLFKSLYELNQHMIQRSTSSLVTNCDVKQHSCEYNLTLINYMEPLQTKTLGLKDEPNYGMGKVSVSWHADSSLEDFSTIGVYHVLSKNRRVKPSMTPSDWKIALRVSPEVRGAATVPPVVMSTLDGDTYYLVGSFNHDHQHMVLAGSCPRISSTHRVAVVEKDTWAYIQTRMHLVLGRRVEAKKLVRTRQLLSPEHLREEQQVLTEIELEWLRQYWIQGKMHDQLRVYWQQPMRQLEEAWYKLERVTKKLVDEVVRSGGPSKAEQVKPWKQMVGILISELTLRNEGRKKFIQREQDRVYQRIVPEYQPVQRLRFCPKKMLPCDLGDSIAKLVRLKKQPPPKTDLRQSQQGQQQEGPGQVKQKIHKGKKVQQKGRIGLP